MAGDHREPSSFLPLTAKDYHILRVLVEGDLHGYAIVKEVEERSGGLVRLDSANLYRRLRRLLGEALIVESDDRPPDPEDDQRRRYYRLTPLGRRVVAAEAERMRALVADARSVELLPGGGSVP